MKPPAGTERSEWDEVLDDLEHALVTGAEYEPPAGLTALPERLVPRAQQLQARQAAAITELTAERDRVGDELAAQRRAPRAASAAAATGASLSL